MPRLWDSFVRRPCAAVVTAVRRRPLVVSTTLIVLGVVAVAPLWWWRHLRTATAAAGEHWLAVLLLVAGLAGVTIHGVGVLRRRRPGRAGGRRHRREPVAVWLPLSAHVAGLLVLAVLVAAGVGGLLWWALGSPAIDPTPAAPAPPAGAATPGVVWTVQNTFDAMKIVLSVVAGIGAVVAPSTCCGRSSARPGRRPDGHEGEARPHWTRRLPVGAMGWPVPDTVPGGIRPLACVGARGLCSALSFPLI